MGQRRRRVNGAQVKEAVTLFSLAPIGLLRPSAASVLELSQNFSLSGYDAAYLAVATMQGAQLASFDAKLTAAATTLGIAMLS